MAGYILASNDEANAVGFHIGVKDLAMRIRKWANTRVIKLQLDGDELDAALWGLENYRKGIDKAPGV